MKILLVDIGPKTVQYFHEVAGHLPTGLEACFYSRLPKVRSKLRRLGRRPHPHTTARTAHPEMAADDAPLFAHLQATCIHLESTAGFRQTVAQHYTELHELIGAPDVSAIFVWNGSGLAASIATYVARQLQRTVIFGENGYFPGTLQIDPQGVNQFSSITGAIAAGFAERLPSDGELRQVQRVIDLHKQGKSPRPLPHAHPVSSSLISKFSDSLQTSYKIARRDKRHSSRSFAPFSAPEDRFVFLPLQVVKDSQLVLHSPVFGRDTAGLIRASANAVAHLPEPTQLVVKLHPADRHTDYSALATEMPHVIFTEGGEIRELLARCSAVITINSTVGFEALFYDKPVIMTGVNLYRIPGVVRFIEHAGQLPQVLAEALRDGVDTAKIKRFLANSYSHYFVHADWRDHSEASYRATADRIGQLVCDARA